MKELATLKQLLGEAVQVIEDYEADPESELYADRVCDALENLTAAGLITWLAIVEPSNEEDTLLALASIFVRATGSKMEVKY